MTRNNGSKQAIRARMAATGEPYMVARRAVRHLIPTFAPYPYLTQASTSGWWHRVPLGVGEGGTEVTLDLSSSASVLIAGGCGTGKTVTERAILAHVLNSPAWQVYGVDLRGDELAGYDQLTGMVEVATTLEHAVDVIQTVEDELRRRYAELLREQVYFFKDLPSNPDTGEHLPAIMVVIDDAIGLLGYEWIHDPDGVQRDQLRERARFALESIARLGRAVGVHLVIATHRASADIIAGEFKHNLTARIACGRMDTAPSQVVLDCDAATQTARYQGRAVLNTPTQGPIEYQGYHLTIEDLRTMATHPAPPITPVRE